MAKCIKNSSGEIKRVSDKMAEEKVENGWRYCSKAEYKQLKRSPKKEEK